MAMDDLVAAQQKLQKVGNFHTALEDVDNTLRLLHTARQSILSDPSSAAVALTQLKTPVHDAFQKLNNDLRQVWRAQKAFNDALKDAFDQKKANSYTYVATDPLAHKTPLVNRAIAMHLLREGQFGVARTFMAESASQTQPPSALGGIEDARHENRADGVVPHPRISAGLDGGGVAAQQLAWEQDFGSAPLLQGDALQERFAEMYHILRELRERRNLQPAIEWARRNAAALESRGSNLEFELCRLKYVALFNGQDADGGRGSAAAAAAAGEQDEMDIDGPVSHGAIAPATDRMDGPLRAWAYARSSFPPFQARYSKEIQQLSAGMAFAPNVARSPYAALFASASAWEDVAASFTREFCSLLGLSADSPLYVAVTAGSIAIPRVGKMREKMGKAGAEWTSGAEMSVEIPLPPAYYYHPIFVCPVSREQATDENPPMMMPCGHVILQESLANTSKGAKFKCPYCPSESHPKEARRVFLA